MKWNKLPLEDYDQLVTWLRERPSTFSHIIETSSISNGRISRSISLRVEGGFITLSFSGDHIIIDDSRRARERVFSLKAALYLLSTNYPELPHEQTA